MPNWVQNRITFASDFGQENMQKFLSAVLCHKKELTDRAGDISSGNSSLTPEERCRRDMVEFDFNTIVPMPAELDVESGSNSDYGMLLYQAFANLPITVLQRIAQAKIFEDIFSYGAEYDIQKQYDCMSAMLESVEDHNFTKEFVRENQEKMHRLYNSAISNLKEHIHAVPALPDVDFFKGMRVGMASPTQFERRIKSALNTDRLYLQSLQDFCETKEGKGLFSLGERCCSNIRKYGGRDWYDWRIANWGTKWNAVGTYVDWDARQIMFQTAWSAPAAIIDKMSRAFPDVEFEWMYAEEDCGCNTGIFTHKNGMLSVNSFENGSNEAYNAYQECWGPNDCMYQDDNGNWNRYDCGSCPHPC